MFAPLLSTNSLNREDDFASGVSFRGPFVRLSRIRERNRAVDRDANRAGIEQASEFRELRAIRAHLGHRDRDAQLRGLLAIREARSPHGTLAAGRAFDGSARGRYPSEALIPSLLH